jgi:arylsulfatase A-like enzyme
VEHDGGSGVQAIAANSTELHHCRRRIAGAGYRTLMVGKWHLNHIHFNGKKQLDFDPMSLSGKATGAPRGFENTTVPSIAFIARPLLVNGNPHQTGNEGFLLHQRD